MTWSYPPWAQQRSNWIWIGAGLAVVLLVVVFRKKLMAMATAVQIKKLVGTLPVSTSLRYTTRAVSAIDTVVIHHSATIDGSAQAYARHHVQSNGWPGIGYHYVIDKDGTINQTNELTTVSYHVTNNNARSVGICLTGNYDTQTPPAVQIEAAIRLIRMLNAQLSKKLQVRGHGELQSKACPGKNVDVRYIEKSV